MLKNGAAGWDGPAADAASHSSIARISLRYGPAQMASPRLYVPRLLLVAFNVAHLGAGLAYRPFRAGPVPVP